MFTLFASRRGGGITTLVLLISFVVFMGVLSIISAERSGATVGRRAELLPSGRAAVFSLGYIHYVPG
jgi:hypothetical protein